jgi:hypothetical protein
VCAQWLQYTEWELVQQQQPARAQFLYERALSEGGACLYDVVWERYSDMLTNSLHAKVTTILLNCYSVHELSVLVLGMSILLRSRCLPVVAH